MNVMLVGNPNCGKTTIFNALTGEHQRVGNWPGVTVEKKTGFFVEAGQRTHVMDLPGVYSLSITDLDGCQDQQITARTLLESHSTHIVNVIDACHLERHLYLTSQLVELGYSMTIVLNMMDVARQRGIKIDQQALSKELNCSVIAVEAHRGIGIAELKKILQRPLKKQSTFPLKLPLSTRDGLQQIKRHLSALFTDETIKKYVATRLLEGDRLLVHDVSFLKECEIAQDEDIIFADARYQAIHDLVQTIQTTTSDARNHLTAQIDKFVLNRFWGLPVFLGVMYSLFFFAIHIGGLFQDFFDITTDTIFVQGVAWLMQKIHMPNWLIALGAHGIGKGINTTLTFIPVLTAMFFFLSLLELSGYMARAAFVVDKIMRLLGLPGKSFVPMIVGFGCNVPAIMAARTLDSERDRLLTVMMSPFMSCSARLAIYTVFVAAFFPRGGQNIVFSLYGIGILIAVFTGYLLRKYWSSGKVSPLIIELPTYHMPSLRRLLKETMLRLRYFLTRASKVIIPACVILSSFNAITLPAVLGNAHQSLLEVFGQWLTPVFSPMGIQQDNWPATVGLLTGMLAKEVVVGSLNTLYMGTEQIAQVADFQFWMSIQSAFLSVWLHVKSLGEAFLNPLVVNASGSDLSRSVYGEMYQRFDGKIGAYAYLLFILLYIPCVSTMAVIRQEASSRLMWFSVFWSLGVAYAVAVSFYQLATLSQHFLQSLFWLSGFLALFVMLLFSLRFYKIRGGEQYAVASP